ncbi:MAG: hypothetical protein HKN11_10860 [Rhizobiales bacterium]|nr:hypothetical protein [Hyphomicrobiales bacterium]
MPEYIAPFDKRIEDVVSSLSLEQLVLADPPDRIVLFKAERFFVIDLSKLANETGC